MKQKKCRVLLMAAALVFTALAAVPATAYAEHIIPGSNPEKPCNNTYVDVSHKGFSQSYQIPSHRMADGRYCVPSRLVYIHRKCCTVCGAMVADNVIFDCEEHHPVCGTYIKGMGH